MARSQAAIDFLTSYGVVILAVSVTLLVIFSFGVFNPQFAPVYCNAAASFSCTAFAMFTNGTLTFTITQTIGTSIKITGIGCSTQVNGTGVGPEFGNVNLIGATQYYPSGGFTSGTTLFTNTAGQFSVYCYSAPGSTPAKGALGRTILGYVWFNYTYSGLPANYPTAQQVFSFSTTYT